MAKPHNPADPEYRQLVQELREANAEWSVWLGIGDYKKYSRICWFRDPFICRSWLFPTAAVISARVDTAWKADYVLLGAYYSDAQADTVVEALKQAFDLWLWAKMDCLQA